MHARQLPSLVSAFSLEHCFMLGFAFPGTRGGKHARSLSNTLNFDLSKQPPRKTLRHFLCTVSHCGGKCIFKPDSFVNTWQSSSLSQGQWLQLLLASHSFGKQDVAYCRHSKQNSTTAGTTLQRLPGASGDLAILLKPKNQQQCLLLTRKGERSSQDAHLNGSETFRDC